MQEGSHNRPRSVIMYPRASLAIVGLVAVGYFLLSGNVGTTKPALAGVSKPATVHVPDTKGVIAADFCSTCHASCGSLGAAPTTVSAWIVQTVRTAPSEVNVAALLRALALSVDDPSVVEGVHLPPATADKETREQPAAAPTPTSTPTAAASPSPSSPPRSPWVTEVEGIGGPFAHTAWLPKRSLLTLPAGVPGNLEATVSLVLDDWLRAEVPPTGKAAGASTNEAGQWPPLPQCVALGGGRNLVEETMNSAAGWPDYAHLPIINTTQSDYTRVVVGLDSTALAGPGAHSGIVRSLLWHRVTVPEGSLLEQPAPHMWPSMGQASRDHYCRDPGQFFNHFAPEVLCDGRPNPSPYYGPDYCFHPSTTAAIVSYDCGVTESGIGNDAVAFNGYTLDGPGHFLTYNRHNRYTLSNSQQVDEFDELASPGTAVYIDAAGHFFNELLPRLVHLDRFLPERVPLMWPCCGGAVDTTLDEFRAAGIISPNRPIVKQDKGRRIVRAKRMYLFQSTLPIREYPLLLASSHRLMAKKLHDYVASQPAPEAGQRGGIVVLRRGPGAPRSLINHDELMRTLRAAFPGKHIIDFQPGSDGWTTLKVAKEVHYAKVVIGPHGANLNNWIGMQPGSTAVEVGFDNAGDFRNPSDFFCLARNLGLRYWLSICEPGGHYGTPMQARIAEIVDIVRGAYGA